MISLYFCSVPGWAEPDITFNRDIAGSVVTINAPASLKTGQKISFIDEQKEHGVRLYYGGLKVFANRIDYDTALDTVEFFDFKGFLENYSNYSLVGEYFSLNPWTEDYSGKNLSFGYRAVSLQVEGIGFYGKKISLSGVKLFPFKYPVFSAGSSKLDIYPGFALAYQNTLDLFRLPFYYNPLYVDDERRSYFILPFPAFEFKKDLFHGKRGIVHSHYFINPKLYGDISAHYSEMDGAGLRVMQLFRLSDKDQFRINFLEWARSVPQLGFSYIHHNFEDPRRPSQNSGFVEQLALEREVATIEPESIFNLRYDLNEENNRSIIDRYMDLIFTYRAHGILYDHIYTVSPSIMYGRIKEKKIFPENAASQEVDRCYERSGLSLDLSYYLETPYLSRLDIDKTMWKVTYEHLRYDPSGGNRGRLSTSFLIRRPMLGLPWLNYEAVLSKVLLDYGISPFYFEEYGRLNDRAGFDIYLQNDYLIAGSQTIYDLQRGVAFNEIYYFGIKAINNYAMIKYDRRLGSWELSFSSKDAAF
jgi:hypothetical protein